MEDNSRFAAFLRLEQSLPEALHLRDAAERKALAELLLRKNFSAAAAQMPLRGDAVCRDTLQLLTPLFQAHWKDRPAMELHTVYDAITAQLFPDSTANTATEDPRISFYLAVLKEMLRQERLLRKEDPLTDLPFLTKEEYAESRIAGEYVKFVAAIQAEHYPELLRIGREIMPFDPLSHVAGVHRMALHLGREAVRVGVPVDVALVSAAALSHDIGKFGCRGDDVARIPYLHYFYTNDYLLRHGLTAIAHVAANHSTWDLEFENLPAASLILIYSDFLVRGRRMQDGREQVEIHTLHAARDIIFEKLADMTPEKARRYQRVYCKLRDFEDYLVSRGANVGFDARKTTVRVQEYPTLLTKEEAYRALLRMSIGHHLVVTDMIDSSASFDRILERARAEKNLDSIRTYLTLLSEYVTYMRRDHKNRTLDFLYELLAHHESDVRRQAAWFMGKILANSGLQYRKELPQNVPADAVAPTLSEMLLQARALWDEHLQKLLRPGWQNDAKHTERIQNSLKIVAESVFAHCKQEDALWYFADLMACFSSVSEQEICVLLDCVPHIPPALLDREAIAQAAAAALRMASSDTAYFAVSALNALRYLLEACPAARVSLSKPLKSIAAPQNTAQAYLLRRCCDLAGQDRDDLRCSRPVSELYLENLKNSVHWSVKIANIDLLTQIAQQNREDAFHTAMHLSNLLLVEEHLPVRYAAGVALVNVAPILSADQMNEIAVDLIRGLETSRAEFSRYIPPTLGTLLAMLPQAEELEGIHLLESYVRSENFRAARAALSALGAVLGTHCVRGVWEDKAVPILGLLFSGLAHFDAEVSRTALTVLCRDVLSKEEINLGVRQQLLALTVKKLYTLLCAQPEDGVSLMNTTAMLNRVYRTAIDCEIELPPYAFRERDAVAFFPGTFDPFSAGHKRIAEQIRELGMEVYLAVDEFSWSKRTQPKLLRRRIAALSVADCFDVYLFPDDIPVNLANASDLAALKELFSDRQLYLVAGSDVIRNASAYAKNGAACQFDHIVFSRNEEAGTEQFDPRDYISGKVFTLKLPTYYEEISSTRIREDIDRNREVSSMVDPIAESFIRKNALYVRTPQFKSVLKPERLHLPLLREYAPALDEFSPGFSDGCRHVLGTGSGYAVLLQDTEQNTALGAMTARSVNSDALLEVLGDRLTAERVRKCTSGKILMLDGVCVKPEAPFEALRMLTAEMLAKTLTDDHTFSLYLTQENGDPLAHELTRFGFLPVPDTDGRALVCDMRAPIVLLQDLLMTIKMPYRSRPEVVCAVRAGRDNLKKALCNLYPGQLVLAFDTEMMNQTLIRRIRKANGVAQQRSDSGALGPFLCVPYGKVLSEVIVPNTVTKTLHVEKVFDADVQNFAITEYPNYAPLAAQVRMLRSFGRPVLLVDDVMHNAYRFEQLEPIFRQERVEIAQVIVGILSGRGRDIMTSLGRTVIAAYEIPNMRYWFTESLMTPFVGGDSIARKNGETETLHAINMVLPYKLPTYIRGSSEEAVFDLSLTALENTRALFQALEKGHLETEHTELTISRLSQALSDPRQPDRGAHVCCDPDALASEYLQDDIQQLYRQYRRKSI